MSELDDLRNRLLRSRSEWNMAGAKAIVEIGEAMVTAGKALGDISREEAVAFLKKETAEIIDKRLT